MTIRYGSVCSGIEAATAAWHQLGWQAQWFSEIENFPSAVLQHHYPDVPNYGDMTKFKEWPNDESIDLLVGGTPCQSFSVAGLRKGLDDPRGNLMLTYLAIAARYRPRWVVWENVPGVLSSNGGRDFGTFLWALGELGYGFAYRTLDAQYFGVAQRRRRVFVVGYLGDWRRAAAVLFERHSLSGNTAPCREKREEAPGYTSSSFGSYSEGVGTIRAAGGDLGGGSETLVTDQKSVGTITASYGTGGADLDTKPLVYGEIPKTAGALDTQCGGGKLTHQSANNGHLIIEREVIGTITANMVKSIGARDVEEGVLHPVVFGAQNSSKQGLSASTEVSPTLDTSKTPAVSYGIPGNWIGRKPENGGNSTTPMNNVAPNLTSADRHGVAHDMKVRRLTPIECERLQGFADNFTQIPYRNKDAEQCPDGPRYKAIGNSMAVPVMRWIGERIYLVESVKKGD